MAVEEVPDIPMFRPVQAARSQLAQTAETSTAADA
jgi:hypothetical protein